MARHAAPNPGVVAVVFTLLFLAGLALLTNIFDTTHFPSPYQPANEIDAYVATRTTRVAWCAALQFGSMMALGVYVATMTSRLRFHGLRVAGVDIALVGGIAAFCAQESRCRRCSAACSRVAWRGPASSSARSAPCRRCRS